MSPEQLAGQPADARSDLYSAALVIHESLTCQLPYVTDKSLVEVCPEATPALQELLDHCLRKDPNARPASALEVYLRLQELGKASGILLLPPGAMDKLIAARQTQQDTVPYAPADTKKSGRRLGWMFVVGVLVLLLGLGVVGVLALAGLFRGGPV
jgi:serine/threonine-protein kinase